jgi:virginiamycin B lyase
VTRGFAHRARRGGRRLLVIATAVAVTSTPSALGALTDASGATIANTATSSATAQLAGGPTIVRPLLDPSSPADDNAAALAALGSIGDPESDLAAALDTMANAADTTAANDARLRALAILDGTPIAGKAYSGIPLLNWNVPTKVKTVPAGGNVTVTEVRFGEHSLSDTALLQFDDPNLPFTITYRVSELGLSTFGGALTPVPLLTDGTTPVGGLSSVVTPLTTPVLPTGTSEINRFHPGGAPEQARHAVQDVTVKMPPPRAVSVVLDPDIRPGRERVATLRPATPERLAAVAASFGFSGSAPTDPEKQAAIAKLAAASPERLLFDELRGLDPTSTSFLDAAHATATQNDQLVAAMRTRYALPAGVPTQPAALDIALVNDEAYASARSVRRAANGAVLLSLTNADAFEHTFAAADLHRRTQVFGALDWGQFLWNPLGAPVTLAPGESRTLSVRPAADSVALWLGDPDHGDQSSIIVNVATSAVLQTLTFGDRSTLDTGNAPEHLAQGPNGAVWVTLAGADKIVKITPSASLASAATQEFIVPGGASAPGGMPLDTHDISVDARGIVWATLVEGNAVLRLDPSLARAGTSDGITMFPLPTCNLALPLCAPPFPAPPPGLPHPPPSREPNQVEVHLDGTDTVVWFTETGADAIGVLRVAADGTLLDQADIPCDCAEPLGIDLAADGSVFFTEGVTNAVGRLAPGPVRPFAPKAMQISHVKIPSGILVVPPPHPGIPIELTPPFVSSGPHSLAIDALGRVWFTEEETSKLGFFDPATVGPNGPTVTELAIPDTDFGAPTQPADLSIDRNNTVFFADEYGDMIGSATTAGMGPRWRPAERASLTDSPMVDAAGDVWFAESGSDLVSRLSDVSAGSSLPAAAPTFVADTTQGVISGAQVADATSVDIAVRRAAQSVGGAANVRVVGGAFRADVPTQPGDVVTITARGQFPREALTFSVANLGAVVPHDQQVTGWATNEGSPLAPRVSVTIGDASVPAAVRQSDGKFHADFPAPVAATASGTITWSATTAAATFQTVTGFVAPPPAPTVPSDPSPPPNASPTVGVPSFGAHEPFSPNGSTATATPAPACQTSWVTADRQIPLLGLRRAQVEACLGRPTRVQRRGTVLRYAANEVHVSRGVVTSVIVRGGMWTSAIGHVGVGSPVAQLRIPLDDVRIDSRRRLAVSHVRLGRRSVAGIRAYTNRAGQITAIEISRQAG